MTRFLFVLIFILSFGLIIGNYLIQYQSNTFNSSSRFTEEIVATSPSPTPTEQPSLPVALSVPKIQINSYIEHVGMDGGGRMDVPVDPDNVGWFKLGPKPGEKGNAVFAGHLDTVTGASAVFYNLNQLEVGDEIQVTNDKGKLLKFKVTDKQVYQFNNFPLAEVFGDHEKPRLNLITCEGVFDQRSQNYSHRTVIYSELIQNN